MTKREEFEDIYNPMKVYAFLRKGFDIPRARARELAEWYSDCFYKVILDYDDKTKQNKLESHLHSNSRDSHP